MKYQDGGRSEKRACYARLWDAELADFLFGRL